MLDENEEAFTDLLKTDKAQQDQDLEMDKSLIHVVNILEMEKAYSGLVKSESLRIGIKRDKSDCSQQGQRKLSEASIEAFTKLQRRLSVESIGPIQVREVKESIKVVDQE